MKNRSGLTLIEVILAVLILSILLITYITAFGQNAIIVSKGKNFTSDTFDHQEIMENRIVEGKRSFIENKEMEDYKIEIFSNYGDYKTTIDTKEIKTNIKGSRQYIAYVTNYEIKEPEAPKINPFEVGVYDSNGNKVFPWYEDNIRLVAKYTLLNNPIIFENRIRWYRSKEEIYNPVFASDYDIADEEIQKEPNAISYTKELTKNNKLIPKRFYYFEARPYTLAGRLEHFRNEDRILVLNRAGSKEWQDFMEDIYFKKATVRRFNINNKDIYIDIMQNPNHPTLNLDWENNENPQGALIGMEIPSAFSNKDFQTKIKFQIDSNAIRDADKLLGIGFGLVDDKNTGLMIDFDVLKNLINIQIVENGEYKNIDNPVKILNTMEDFEFKAFKDKNNGAFDWSKEYSLIIEYLNGKNKINIKLEDDTASSDIIEIDLQNYSFNPKYIGFKSYSNINYKPDTKYEIVSKYDRNFSSHFYDIGFEEIEENTSNLPDDNDFGNNRVFYQDEGNGKGTSVIRKGSVSSEDRINLNRHDMKVTGHDSTIVAKSFKVSESLTIKQQTLTVKIKEYIIFNRNLIIEKSSGNLKIEAVDNSDYPVYAYFKKSVFNNLSINSDAQDYTVEEFTENGDIWIKIKINDQIIIKNNGSN